MCAVPIVPTVSSGSTFDPSKRPITAACNSTNRFRNNTDSLNANATPCLRLRLAFDLVFLVPLFRGTRLCANSEFQRLAMSYWAPSIHSVLLDVTDLDRHCIERGTKGGGSRSFDFLSSSRIGWGIANPVAGGRMAVARSITDRGREH